MALALRERWQQERNQPALRRWWRGMQRRWGQESEDVLTQAADDWWMETFVQLTGLVDDADQLARAFLRSILGWRCGAWVKGAT